MEADPENGSPSYKKRKVGMKGPNHCHRRYFGKKKRKTNKVPAPESNIVNANNDVFKPGETVAFRGQDALCLGFVNAKEKEDNYTILNFKNENCIIHTDSIYKLTAVSVGEQYPSAGETVLIINDCDSLNLIFGRCVRVCRDTIWAIFDSSGLEFSVPFHEAFIMDERSKDLLKPPEEFIQNSWTPSENPSTREAVHLFTCMLNRLSQEVVNSHKEYREKISAVCQRYAEDIDTRDVAVLKLKQEHLHDTVMINNLQSAWVNRWGDLNKTTLDLQEKLTSAINEKTRCEEEIMHLRNRLSIQESLFSRTCEKLVGEINVLRKQNVGFEDNLHKAVDRCTYLESMVCGKEDEILDLQARLDTFVRKEVLEVTCKSENVLEARNSTSTKRSSQYVKIVKPVISSANANSRSLSERGIILKQVLELVSSSETPSHDDLVATLTHFVKTNPTLTMESCRAASVISMTTFSPGETVDLKVLLKLPMSRFRDLRTFLANKGMNIFANEGLMRDEMKDRIPADSLVEVGEVMLKKNGAATETYPVAFCRVRDFKASVENFCLRHISASPSKSDLDLVEFPEEFQGQVFIKLGGDKGGTSSKLVLQVVNLPRCNSAENTEILGMFEAFDSAENVRTVFSPLRDGVSKIDGQNISLPAPLNDSLLRVFIFGDYAWLCNILGHQGAGSSFPCVYCLLPLQKLRDGKGSIHSACVFDEVKNDWVSNEEGRYEQRSVEMYKADLAGFLNDSRNKDNQKLNGKYHNSVVRDMVFPVPVDQVVPPPLHIFLGLVKTAYEMLENECIEIDRNKMSEVGNDKIRDLYDEWKKLTVSVVEIDSKLECAKTDLAEKNSFVQELVKNKRKNSEYRANCASPICVVTPSFDPDAPDDEWLQCKTCNRWVHLKCAGISELDEDTEYKCYKCCGVRTKEKLVDEKKEMLKEAKNLLKLVEKSHTTLHRQLDTVYEEVKKYQGPLEKELTRVLEHELLVYKQAYHSNAFIGNHCKKIIEKPHALVGVLLKDGFQSVHDRYLEVFNRMAKIYRLISLPRFLTDCEIRTLSVACWSYGCWFPLNFPKCSITVKFHLLTYHIPDFAFKWRTVGLMGEQGAESIHKLINHDKRIYACVRDSELQMKLLYANHALRTTANSDHLKKVERKCRKTLENRNECPGRLKRCPAAKNEKLCQICNEDLFKK